MITEPINIGHIPAIVRGAPSSKAYLFVHGKQSLKEEALGFAGFAARKGCQTLSFDLPSMAAAGVILCPATYGTVCAS